MKRLPHYVLPVILSLSASMVTMPIQAGAVNNTTRPAASSPASSPGKPLKIGVLDVREILEKSPQAKTVGEKLRKEFQSRENNIISQEKSLQEKEQKLERNTAVMGEAERGKLEREVMQARRDVQRLQAEFREDTAIRQREEMQKFVAKLKTIVEDLAKTEHYDLVIHSEAVPYSSENITITAKVMKLLEEKG